MTRQITTYILLLIVCLQTSCKKYPKRGDSVNRGDIIDNFKQPDCYSVKTYTNDECIIKSIADFDTIKGSTCLPGPIDFDFNSFSVIGKTIRFGCEVKIIRDLKIDHDNKQYIYTINFKDVGICKKLGFAFNLVKVPKIPSDYTVVFNVHED
jgi:hypothetical protein